MNRTFLLVILLSVSLIALASRPAKFPLQGDLVGHWVGFEASYPNFYRLNLRGDNTGTLVVLYPQAEPDIYGVRWRLNEKQLELDALPLTTNSEVFTGHMSKVDFRQMTVVFSGVSNQWKRTALLLNEKSLAAGIAESSKHDSKASPKGKLGNSTNEQ